MNLLRWELSGNSPAEALGKLPKPARLKRRPRCGHSELLSRCSEPDARSSGTKGVDNPHVTSWHVGFRPQASVDRR